MTTMITIRLRDRPKLNRMEYSLTAAPQGSPGIDIGRIGETDAPDAVDMNCVLIPPYEPPNTCGNSNTNR